MRIGFRNSYIILSFTILSAALFQIINFAISLHTIEDIAVTNTNFHSNYYKTNDNDIPNENRKWCPNAICTTRQHCEPCKQKYLFILGQARSGTTTIKNMLNFLPNIRIRGEFSNRIDFYLGMETIMDVSYVKPKSAMIDTFGHYKYPDNHLLCTIQKFVEELNPSPLVSSIYDDENVLHSPSTIIGFKEVHRLTYLIKALVKNFPCSRYIFSIRSNETALSLSRSKYIGDGSQKQNHKKVPIMYNKMVNVLGPNRVYLMDIDEWSKGDGSHFTDLSSWLGFKNCLYDGVRHDNVNGFNSSDKQLFLGNDCHYEK